MTSDQAPSPVEPQRPVSTLWTSWQLLRHFGPGWAAYRLQRALQRRSGWLARREAAGDWGDVRLSSLVRRRRWAEPDVLASRLFEGPSRFFFPSDFAQRSRRQLCAFDDTEVPALVAARRLAAGEFRLFHGQVRDLGAPPDWRRNCLTGEAAPVDVHWSRIGDFDHGDIKAIWDLSRFSFAFDLARAYARSGDERWPELFWTLFEDWRHRNPPNLGPNWKCGQEASFRAMAWCFALFAMARSEHTTPRRVAQMAQALAFTAERVAGHVAYAISQQNNHAISEAVGLFTIGALLPELQSAQKWRQTGRQLLRRLARELIYDDGAFAQHSWNYHRLMLHDYLWAVRVAEVGGDPFETDVVERVSRAGELLYQVMDARTGGVPCYGQDDGSLILPLNNCSYFDYRPVVQATAAIASGQRLLERGPWDEDVFWLQGDAVAKTPLRPVPQRSMATPVGGYVVLRTAEGFAFSRAGSFRHRPGQADMLHVDIWWRGENIAVDPGTFAYNAGAPWNNSLARTPFHNTVTVDGRDQMTRAGRFVWLPWLSCRSFGPLFGDAGHLACWQGEHDGYRALPSPVRHRRALLRLPDEHWLVLDRLESPRPHQYRLHWLLHDWPHTWSSQRGLLQLAIGHGAYRVQMGTDATTCSHSLVRADDSSPRGWSAHGYQRRRPAISIDTTVATNACWFWTLLGPAEIEGEFKTSAITARAPHWTATVQLNGAARESLVDEAQLEGEWSDRLAITP